MELIPAAKWTDDCQGKKNYDGPLLDISSRYWPGGDEDQNFFVTNGKMVPPPMPFKNKNYTALSQILLRHDDESFVWRKSWFQGSSEIEVKEQVEHWVKQQMHDIVGILGGVSAFYDDFYRRGT